MRGMHFAPAIGAVAWFCGLLAGVPMSLTA